MSEILTIDCIIDNISLTDYLTKQQFNYIIRNYGVSLKVYIINAYYTVYYDIFNEYIVFDLIK